MFSRLPYTAADVLGTGVPCYIRERYVTQPRTRLYYHIHTRHSMPLEVLRSTEFCRLHRREEEVWRQAEAARPGDDDLMRADEDIPDPGKSRSGERSGA